MKEQIEMKFDIRTSMNGKKEIYPLDENNRLLLFRSVRELLINAAKHAKAKHLNVYINHNNNVIELIIQDDGIGMDYQKIVAMGGKKSYGFFSIQERLNDLGGAMRVTSIKGKGTKIKITAPLITTK
jgi:signal transduction histidine kinase